MTNKKNIMNADLSPIEFRESLNFEEHDMKKEEFDKKIACAKQYINSVITSKNQITSRCSEI